MKKPIPFASSPEGVGAVCGLMMLVAWPVLDAILLKAGWALGGIALIASLAGFVVAGQARWIVPGTESRVRRGAWAGVFAVMMAAACLVLMARMKWTPYVALRAILIAVASTMPAIMAATIAAGGGAVLFRPDEPMIPAPVPGAGDLPRSVQLLLRTGIILALLAALLSPLVPQRPMVHEVVSVPAAVPLVTKEVEPARPLPPPRELFKYSMPEALKTALPVSWSVRTQREIGPIQSDHGLALSRTGSLLAGLEPDGRIVVHDLDSESVRRMPPLPSSVLQLTISPDSKRLFVVLEGDPRKVGVVDVETGRYIALPQPKKHAVPDSKVTWWKELGVVFLTDPKTPLMLDLETLEFNPANLMSREMERITQEVSLELPKNDRWSFEVGSKVVSAELPEVENTRDWQWRGEDQLGLVDRIHASKRTFSEFDIRRSERLFGTMDGSKILQIRNGRLSAFYFETGPVPPLRWKITLPHGPDRIKERDAAMQALAHGELSLLMYAPLINPLNEKTIGPDRESPKAILHFLRWTGTEAEVWIEAGTASYSPGDVLADVHVPGSPPQLLSLDQPHHWWMLAPEPLPDATDVTKLPLRSGFTKRGDPTGDVNNRLSGAANPPNAGATAPLELDDIQKEVSTLVYSHHAAASSGRLRDVVGDYADRVDHFNNGFVDRNFIYDDELKYHQKYKYVRENVQTAVAITPIREGRVEANYIMMNEWQRLSDNVMGTGVFRVILTLDRQAEGWKIIKHRAIKQN